MVGDWLMMRKDDHEETVVDKHTSNFSYRLKSFEFKLRDLIRSRKGILKEVGIKPGFQVLDYGCGPGESAIPVIEVINE